VPSSDFAALVQSPDRTEADRALDAGRKPEAFLAFIDAQPGMHVGELFAGGGYTTELLARAVGPIGVVYGQNSPQVLQRFAEKPWTERLARPINNNVRRLDLPFETPFPGDVAGQLDRVVTNANYHDLVWLGVDRDRMNRAVLAALKPDGAYIVCDSSAKPGRGIQDVQTLHRIEENVVETEVTKAGFRLEGRGDFLRNPHDPRDWNASPRAAGGNRGTSDRFCFRFVRR
jgi:predicted methyltransferase